MGDTLENVSADLDTQTFRRPLGVVLAVCPFNFPAMIPLWVLPVAVVCGNAVIIKPSEKLGARVDAYHIVCRPLQRR